MIRQVKEFERPEIVVGSTDDFEVKRASYVNGIITCWVEDPGSGVNDFLIFELNEEQRKQGCGGMYTLMFNYDTESFYLQDDWFKEPVV